MPNRTAESRQAEKEIEASLIGQVGQCWDRGWQPIELARQARRDSAPAGRLMTLIIAVDNTNRRATTLHQRWMAQVSSLGLPAVSGRPGWLGDWVVNEGLGRQQALYLVSGLSRALAGLPPLDVLIPPPGSAEARSQSGRANSCHVPPDASPLLNRIRGLLAKAESTEFEAEATAFTAKAHELMTRHAIDAAAVANGMPGADAAPTMIRVLIDAPYVDAKALLLTAVAEASRCRTGFHADLAMCTVMGLADDLAAVEMLFMSLLVQVQTALTEAARSAAPGVRVRSQAFRSAFLIAFARRISERLSEINEQVFEAAEAELGSRFQMVLHDKSAALDEAFSAHFGPMAQVRVRGGYDSAGYSGGLSAADRAKLRSGDLVQPHPSRGQKQGIGGGANRWCRA